MPWSTSTSPRARKSAAEVAHPLCGRTPIQYAPRMPHPEAARPIGLRPVKALRAPQPGDVLLSFTVSFDGEAVLAWASPAEEAKLLARDVRRGGSFPRSVLAAPGSSLRVTIESANGHESYGSTVAEQSVRELRGVTPCFPTVHRLPGDELLVLGARASYGGGDPEHNAVIYGADGKAARSACLGDGISHSSVTAAGAIWVGYFDEGVFGNLGWGGGGSSHPIGAPGWNRFAPSLQLTWSHPEPEEGEIADCYALTTTGEECLVCPYTDWPILRVSGSGRFERFPATRISGASEAPCGAHALLAFGPQLALIGGYSDARDRITAGTITHKGLQWSEVPGQLFLEGQPWNARSPLWGRDGVLHTVFEGTWYSVDVGHIIETLR